MYTVLSECKSLTHVRLVHTSYTVNAQGSTQMRHHDDGMLIMRLSHDPRNIEAVIRSCNCTRGFCSRFAIHTQSCAILFRFIQSFI